MMFVRVVLFLPCLLVLVMGWPGEVALCSGQRSGPSLFRAGVKALKKGQYDRAVQLLQEAHKQLSHWGLVHLELARAMQFSGMGGQKVAYHVKKATELIANNPRAQLFAAQFWESQGQNKQALVHYQKAMKLGHYAPTACLRAATIWISQQQAKRAIPCLRKLRKAYVRSDRTHFLLALAYQQSGDVVKAGTNWMRALSKRPNSLALLQRVYLFYKQHVPKEPPSLRREWLRIRRNLQTRLRKMLPKKKQRRLRMLRPSSR